jgi:hypothetical protein
MDLHERQQFDFLLQVAVERYVERLEQVGPERLRISGFVDAIFNDFLLDNADGACFVLRALAQQNAPSGAAGNVEQVLMAMAKAAFSDLIRRKIDEALELRKIS